MPSLSTIDLFAGCGGLTLGLHRAGFDLLFAVEKDPMAFETFKTNFLAPDAPYAAGERWPDWLPRAPLDVEALLRGEAYRDGIAALRGSVDLICGGPPCQGFSVGGIRNGKDGRNSLPADYLEFVKLVRPSFVLLENVEGMARKFVSQPGDHPSSYAEWFRDSLGDLGYDAQAVIIDSSAFGVPQQRRRLFIFGVDNDLGKGDVCAADFFRTLYSVRPEFLSKRGLPTDTAVTAGEAISDLDGETVPSPDTPGFLAGTYRRPKSAYARLMRSGIPDGELPDSHRFSNHKAHTLEFYKRVQAEGRFGRLPKDFLLSLGTKKDKKVLMDPSSPASTITSHPDEFIHYRVPRNVSVREMARLQSFPDDFTFHGRYTINGDRRGLDVSRCVQVGNAVPPLLAEALGEALVSFDRFVRAGSLPPSFRAAPRGVSPELGKAQLVML